VETAHAPLEQDRRQGHHRAEERPLKPSSHL